jgi:chemotaxis protein MotB
MAGTVWDDDDGVEKATKVAGSRKTPPPVPGTLDVLPDDDEPDEPEPRKREMRWLPWLCVALLGAGWIAHYARSLHDQHAARADLQTARDEAAEFRGKAFHAEAALVRERDDHAAELAALKEKVTAHGSEKAANEKLISDLRAQLDAKTGEVSSDANQIAVNLVDQILFKSGDADLSPEGKKVLDRVGAVLKKLTDKQILIGGHTDSRPIHNERFASNWELSAARAVNVVRYLGETVGVDASKLTAAGFSQYHPRGRSLAKNRRIEILLTPSATVAHK